MKKGERASRRTSSWKKGGERRKQVRPNSKDKAVSGSNKLSTKSVSPCSCCKEGSHDLNDCYKFVLKLNLFQKMQFVDKESPCRNCLRFGHDNSICPTKKACKFCQDMDHHYLLCVGEELLEEITVNVESDQNYDPFNFAGIR